MNKTFDKAWDFVWNELYNPETHTFYDYKSSRDKDGTFRHLPTPAEILASVPNPCSWNTGMEDGGIIAGLIFL